MKKKKRKPNKNQINYKKINEEKRLARTKKKEEFTKIKNTMN